MAKNQIPYRTVYPLLDRGSRPEARMPIERHEEVGLLLCKMQLFLGSLRFSRIIEEVKSELDNWLTFEYDLSELPPDRYKNIYYADQPELEIMKFEESKARIAPMLEQVKSVLQNNYPVCVARDAVVEKIDSALALCKK